MATPASSATSPSPPMAYLHHVPGLQQSLQSGVSNTLELDQRKPAVDKFLARAEIAMVTRRLRAHLAYASYKATHNISHATLRDLEAQSQIQSAPSTRTVAAKRRAANYGAGPGLTSTGAGSQRRGGTTSMAPPASISRPHFSATTSGQSNLNDAASSQRSTGQAPNLFASILALPSMKQARTIHNPNDPPIPAPERPTQSPHVSKTSHRNDPARSKAKRSSKPKKVTTSPNRRKKKTDKGKAKQRSDNMDVDGEMDMKAAATLTSLFLHHRPSVGGSASSPRSSIDGSEIGSVHSHSHFSQSSARTSSQNAAAAPSTLGILAEPSFRSQTPPPSRSQQQHTTPRAAPTDSEAADLMLYLATSPSPVRPPKNKDASAYRTLTGEKGRILFPSNSTTDRDPAERDGIATSSANLPYREPSALTRGSENSFLSSISSINTDLGGSRTDVHGSEDTSSTAAPTAPHLSQLLPPVPLTLSTPSSPARRKPSPHSRVPGSDGNGSSALEFNFHDFINASPSPSRGVSSGHANASDASAYRPNLGLRADVGRKLFEEEQMRQATQAVVPPPRQQERTLGASIDLVHT